MSNKTFTAYYRASTPEEMVASFEKELESTPKRKFLRRIQLRRIIAYWKGQL